MEENIDRKLNFNDHEGNSWEIFLRQQDKYPTRYDLFFAFNGKRFLLQPFAKHKDAQNFWDLLELIPKRGTNDTKNVG